MRSKTIAISMLFLISSVVPAFAEDDAPPVRRISTSGRGEVKVVPDTITVSFGVLSRDTDLDIAKRENDKRVAKVLALAQKYNLDAEKVQTSSMQITPHYKSDYAGSGAGEFLGYSVNKSIIFTLHKAVQLEALVSDALLNGANTIMNISFENSEVRKHMDEARVMAVRAAKEKAELLADTLGMSVGHPLTIREDSQQWPGFSGASNALALYSVSPSDEVTGPPTFALGQISITAEVSVEFEMTPKAPAERPSNQTATTN